VPPTFTPPPVAPLITRTWEAAPVLVRLGSYGGDGGGEFKIYFETLPSFVLYSDGQLVIEKPVSEGVQLLQAKLDRSATCAVLNTIDQIGFFDYDPSAHKNFEDLLGDGVPNTVIEVNAWRSQYVDHNAIGYYIDKEDDPVIKKRLASCNQCILPSLRATYRFLRAYQPDGLTQYKPSQLLLVIEEENTPIDDSLVWNLKNASLTHLYGESGKPVKVMMYGADAAAIYEELGGMIGWNPRHYVEDERGFLVFARPLLPYESQASFEVYPPRLPAPDVPAAAASLTCYPSDGVLKIPLGH
jgi:hypothetical protein